MKIEKWGLIQAWLSGDSGRMVMVTCGMKGLQVTVIDPNQGERVESVEGDEDPSSAALRGISLFGAGSKNSSGTP